MKKIAFTIMFTVLTVMVFSGTAQAANEIVIHEYPTPYLSHNGSVLPVYPPLITSQYLDIAEASAAFNAKTEMISVCNQDAATIHFVIAASSPSATANTDGNSILGAGMCKDIAVSAGDELDTAQ